MVPSNCDIQGNEEADAMAKECTSKEQRTTKIDLKSAMQAAEQKVRTEDRENTRASWHESFTKAKNVPHNLTEGLSR